MATLLGLFRRTRQPAWRAPPIDEQEQHKRPPAGRRTPMTTSTWITMIAVMVCVWGGFFWVLLTAIRKESRKSACHDATT